MSRTFKDRQQLGTKSLKKRQEPLTRDYLRLKRHGPCDPGDVCPECGGLTDLQDGFLVCSECNWNDGGLSALDQHFGPTA